MPIYELYHSGKLFKEVTADRICYQDNKFYLKAISNKLELPDEIIVCVLADNTTCVEKKEEDYICKPLDFSVFLTPCESHLK